jgi:hypothetical protein
MAALAAAGMVVCSSCSMKAESGSGLVSYQAYDRPATPPNNPSAVEVKVSLSKQRAYVMEEGKMLMVMPVSVGKPDSPTPTGSFRISKKEHKHRSTTHGYAHKGKQVRKCGVENKPSGWSFKGTPMPYWCEFTPKIGFHTGWIRHSPCTSDGTIRMHENLAPKFFQMVSIGTPVNISYTQPEDLSWANIPLPPRFRPAARPPRFPVSGRRLFHASQEPGVRLIRLLHGKRLHHGVKPCLVLFL